MTPMKNTGILTIIITIFIFVGCASQPKQAALDKEPPAESVAVEVSPAVEEVVVKSEKATIYFDRTTKKWSLEKKDRKQPRYVGEIADGIPSGKGALYLPNGFYEGEFKNGKFNGKGKRLYFEKGKLVGEFKNNKAHGQGTYTYLDGRKYVGEYKKGKKHGRGTFTWPNGSEYVGYWKFGKREGHGIRTYSNGGKYEGEWKNGLFDGQGTYIFEDGRRYEGEWKNDKIWNAKMYNKEGNVIKETVKGKIKQ